MSSLDINPNVIPPLATNVTLLVLDILTAGQVRSLPDCASAPLSSYPVSNAERAHGLVSELTIAEILNRTGDYIPGVDRLGLPPFSVSCLNNAYLLTHRLHESGAMDRSYARPGQQRRSALGDRWKLQLRDFISTTYSHGEAISTETRAFGNAGRAGLEVYTPNINPFKDPRWGRGKETPGEDPFHISSYTRSLVAGFEGKDPQKKKVITTCKHFAAYDLEKWGNVTRYTFDAKVTLQDLAEYYTPPFEACARDAKAGSMMCTYNSLNGVPTCTSSWLMNDLLRGHWGWDKSDHYISSDCAALDVVYVSHDWTETPEETAADAVKSGIDLDCGVFLPQFLPAAYHRNLIDRATVTRAVNRIYGSLVTLGYFDPIDEQPYRSIDWSSVGTPKIQTLARRAATSGMTLLKNADSLLPLSLPGFAANLTIALVGDWANATTQMQSGYSGIAPYLHSPLYALQQLPGVVVNYVEGLDNADLALEAAGNSDIVIYIGGIDDELEAEMVDRYTIAWNSTQTSLINSLAALGKPTVVVQMGGGQLDDSDLLANDNVSAILWAGYPGQDGGPAIADILFGKVAPAGRLPITQYPAKYVNEVAMTDMTLRPHANSPGRTYMWYKDEPVRPFGFGLHYTSFGVKAMISTPQQTNDHQGNDAANGRWDSWGFDRKQSHWKSETAELIKKCSPELPIDRCTFADLAVAVENRNQTTSDYSVLAFLKGEFGPSPYPNKQLIGYKRVHDIIGGITKSASIPITLGALSRWDEKARRILYPGNYTIAIDVDPELATVAFEITGDPQILEVWPEYHDKQM
nr:putative exo-1,4-beta-xylosidase xlnd [Quercus suber]